MSQNDMMMSINAKEKKLIELIRKIGYGEVKVIIQDGYPIRIEEVKRSIKL
ncbi:DUF2292 domain-containing protein [Inediibacterium massiliense]|uniref:DUF2292 domain-containing protein n=1 Tax=Inediibacterium massiliense TaxID=1658111 RepID=UPI0018FEDFEB|nr:DUF2292 domain-containing protein [Inediibacterium massiliense]